MQEERAAAGPPEATAAAQDSIAATITVSSQHLRFDLCTDTAPAAAPHLKREEQCPLLNLIGSVRVSELQVIFCSQS